MIGDKRYKWIMKASLGSAIVKNEKDVLKVSAGYTAYKQQPLLGTSTYILGNTPGSISGLTTITNVTQPDVPRVLTVTGLNAASAGEVQIIGTNVEGKVITDLFVLAGASTITGIYAFKTVTKVVIPVQTGGYSTITVGTTNTLGLYHRLEAGQFTIRVVLDSTSAATSLDNQTFDSQPTVKANETLLESNTIAPVTLPNGSTWYRIYYAIFAWSLNNTESKEGYFTSTSTSSTSSSTSTTTVTTSTSSTSSSSSTSVSSTSSSL